MRTDQMVIKHGHLNLQEGQVHYLTAGTGKPLLLLHQTAFSSEEFRPVIPYLANQFTVYAMDTIGYGTSEAPPHLYTISDYARNVVAFLDALNIDSVAVVGHHTGATIAIELAVQNPKLVSRLVLSGCPYYDAEERRQRLASSEFHPPEAKPDGSHLMAIWQQVSKRRPKAGVEAWQKWLIAKLQAGPRGNEAHLAVLNYMEQENFPKISCPTLVLSGREDTFVSKIPDMCRLIPDSRPKLIGGSGLVTYEYPEEFATSVSEFCGIG